MKPEDFVKKYYPFAKEVETETSIPAIAILAQAALESGWGEKSIGNNIFGIKFKKGDWGYQKALTTEYSSSPSDFKGKEVVSKTYIPEINKYKYKLYCYFADYPSPKEAFLAHSELLLTKRYNQSLRWSYSPKRYLISIWRSGYATDPNYGRKMCQMVNSINKRL